MFLSSLKKKKKSTLVHLLDQFRRRDTAQNGMAAFQYDDVSLSFYSFACLFVFCLLVFFFAVLRAIFFSKFGKWRERESQEIKQLSSCP